MNRYLFRVILIILLFINLVSCGPSNTNDPNYIKELAIYNEGDDGFIVYLILADKLGSPTAKNGVVWLLLSVDDCIVLSIKAKIKASDFEETKIGLGPYKREAIILPFGRFSYNNLLHTLQTNCNKDIDSLKGKEGIASLNFAWGELGDTPDKIVKDKSIELGKKYSSMKFGMMGMRMAIQARTLKDLEKNKTPKFGVLSIEKPFIF
jgi:hypothetical protein